jgi:hypothetical protein
MKRLLLVLTCLLILGVGTAQAIPGPDPAGQYSYFNIEITARDNGVNATDVTRFEKSIGWDFGDRSAYRCAWVEFFDSGTQLFEVQYHAVSDYPGDFLEINDRYGLEAPDTSIADTCWSGDDPSNFLHDGSDHFPHGTSLVFRDAATSTEIGRIDYPNQCARLYWTPGNRAAEAWLWWDEDGPEDKLEHGDGLCGGGPMEPIAVVQASARAVGPGIEACVTDAMDGDLCTTTSGPTGSAHQTRVTLSLSGHKRATGYVRVPDGTVACRRNRVVIIQRRAPNGWERVGGDRTSDAGRYSDHIRGRDGIYRARVLKTTLAEGDTCKGDLSRRTRI